MLELGTRAEIPQSHLGNEGMELIQIETTPPTVCGLGEEWPMVYRLQAGFIRLSELSCRINYLRNRLLWEESSSILADLMQKMAAQRNTRGDLLEVVLRSNLPTEYKQHNFDLII